MLNAGFAAYDGAKVKPDVKILQQANEVIAMNNNIYTIGASLLLMLMIEPSYAADVDAGKSKAQMCVGCHGSEGVSGGPMWPNLAGQRAAYLEAQLKHFKSGQRQNGTMTGIAVGLADDDIKNLAAYFANLPAKSAGGNTALAQTGKDKATMCMGCHGSNLEGRGYVPKLAGQHPKYLAKQLNDFKTGDRMAGLMNAVAKNLSDEDISALSEYLGSL